VGLNASVDDTGLNARDPIELLGISPGQSMTDAPSPFISMSGTRLPEDLIMFGKKYLPHLLFTAVCAVSSFSYAAEQPSVTMDRPGAGVKEIKEGDNAPDQYQRPSLALKDWKARHLSAPDKNQQWVQLEDKYALIDIPTGTIKQMVPAKGHK
jgi:hypothetical protein